ncbi:RHS repeat domain-containing protein [Lysinibacillus sp. UGB7]|uniref:RHS repeat domain-containing protein n=1 Tax=Lysinibacillus sp. UGB7 TaxID=3411039 RepID=UPI003B7DC827
MTNSYEIERILPGDVISKWQYDVTGRPTQHRISSQNRDTRRRVYNWDVNHQLRSTVNELTGVRVTYGYDEFSNLVWSNQGGQFDFLYRSVDDVGNLYETKDKKDRVYGAGSRLLETREATFFYDEEGNLVKKVEKNGDTWKYEYYGNGMMSKVIRPDNKEVTFKYDSLGRRIKKSSDDKTIQFVWDGNTILHEYCSRDDSDIFENSVENSSQTDAEMADNLVTWVFSDGFVPSAKITSEGNYSIISDYLGTPVEAYDQEGKKVWSAELDVYGRVKEFTGEQDFIPFRYQGQYEDVEIGLYYNRFRYYDPEQGNYTQIDPIGLAGGNPTLYGYVRDTNNNIDKFGLYSDLLDTGMGHHLMPRSIAKALDISELSQINSISWYPDEGAGTAELHKKLHRKLIEDGIPYHGSKFTGTTDEFFEKAAKAYEDIDVKGYLKIPYTKEWLFKNLTPAEGLEKLKELHSNGKIPCG